MIDNGWQFCKKYDILFMHKKVTTPPESKQLQESLGLTRRLYSSKYMRQWIIKCFLPIISIIQMSSIEDGDGSSIMGGFRDEMKKQNDIFRAVSEYEQRCESDEQTEETTHEQEMSYQGFQNKRSLQIKPVHMFKDIITLRKENMEKKQQVRDLECLNEQLRAEYDDCVSQNGKLENFLKEVEFTFQTDKKKTQASEVMLRARRTLFQEAKEAKDRLKRMFRNSQASSIQELKLYIATLEAEKERLKKMTHYQQQKVVKRISEEDFNASQVKKYEMICQTVRTGLTNQVQKVKTRHEDYKIEKMEIKESLKLRLLEARKKSAKEEAECVKKLLLQTEGLEYEIGLLRHRCKDRKKELAQYEQLQERIRLKEGTIVRLQKELRQKNKTFDYMLQWTKQLKKQLEVRKSQHTSKKAYYEDQINTLSEKYEEYNQKYKAGLFEEQVARRRGPRDPQPHSQSRPHPLGRQVTFQQIKSIVKSLTFYLLLNSISTEKFIDKFLRINENHENLQPKQLHPEGKKLQIRSAVSIDCYQTKDTISLQQLAQNLEKISFLKCSKEEKLKLTRFIVEDGSIKAEEQTGISLGYARLVIRNLLQRCLESFKQITAAWQGLKTLFINHSQGVRQQMKVAGGRQEEIEFQTMKGIFLKYAIDPYNANLFSQFLQFYGWKKRKQVGFAKLEDLDDILHFAVRRQDEALMIYLKSL